ncbi:L-aspartate oxidase [Ekhidna sp.]|uniref:L-aspartate oxidase n=1 Tax=Ekhidna sp. TaxID=2608089 RepID=UPI003B591E95
MRNDKKYDLLVVGSGIAGLMSAINVGSANKQARVAVITKSDLGTTNTRMAQGGVAVTLSGNDKALEQHVQDTLRAGAGLCNESVVRMVVGEGASRIEELMAWGVRFDQSTLHLYDMVREGGHSTSRILHHKDKTGEEIQRVLLRKVHNMHNVQLLSHHHALELIVENEICYGAQVLNDLTGEIQPFYTSSTLLATGGIGQVYCYTTNPTIATGDGIAMAHRGGAQIGNMEFIQFHPTALYSCKRESPVFLISEAVRGFGAYLRNNRHERFMHKYDDLEELACRDKVAQAIDKEMKHELNDFVYLDCRHLDKESFENGFPNISRKLADKNLDISSDLIPVMPAMHYLCGGINVDKHGQTSIGNLLACGECANTGMHGANRLASNSLLEAMVFSHRCANRALVHITANSCSKPDKLSASYLRKEMNAPFLDSRKHSIQSVMERYVGISRMDNQLVHAFNTLVELSQEIEDYYHTHKISLKSSELRNLATVAQLIVRQSINRKESVGSFSKEYNEVLKCDFN